MATSIQDPEKDEQFVPDENPSTMPSSGYNALRIAIDPNDPNYLPKMAHVGVMEGQHELNDQNNANVKPGAQGVSLPEPPNTEPVNTEKAIQAQQSMKLEKSGVSKLYDRASQIQNKPLRILGKIGAGLLGGAEATGEAMFPTIAERIPGSITQTADKNSLMAAKAQQSVENASKLDEMLQKPELAEYHGALQQAIQDMKDNAAMARVQTNVAGRETVAGMKLSPAQELMNDLMKGDNGQPRLNPATGQPWTVQEAYGATQKASSKPVQGEMNGKPTWGLYDPQQGWLDPETHKPLTDFTPPPNWGESMLGAKVIRKLGPDGVAHAYQMDALTGEYSKDLGPDPTGQVASQIAQASATEDIIPKVIEDVKANAQSLGHLRDYLTQWALGTPIADPGAAKMLTELTSVAKMQPVIHAFRSKDAADAFEKLIGGLATNPDAIVATLQGLLAAPEAITRVVPKAQPNTKGTHSFYVGDTLYQGVPDADYERAKKLKGFKESQ